MINPPTGTATEKPLLAALSGVAQARPPFWLMRQAGRYLPEYLATRRQAGSFLDLVYNPDLAAEVTLQPLRRFGMDAAILFSDILTVPQALGRRVTFEAGEGPRLDPLKPGDSLPVFDPDAFDRILQPVYDAVGTIRHRLAAEGFRDTALIGFAGAPWTLACYMIEGGGSRDFMDARVIAQRHSTWFYGLVDVLADATIHYLSRQIEAGAEAVQLFDSWAGVLSSNQFAQWSFLPANRIVLALRDKYPHIPVIGFPKGASAMLPAFASGTGIRGLSIDHSVPIERAVELVTPWATVQGNLDPATLLAGGRNLDSEVDHILETMAGWPFVFNLGHGIHKDTPVAHVATLAKRIKA